LTARQVLDGGAVRECEGVVLAAGLSTRMGQYKMTLPLGNKTVLEKSIEGMHQVVRRILVVVGWEAERIRELLAPYDKVELVTNRGFRSGMFSSIKAGIAKVRAPSFFLLPGDCPFVGNSVYRQMLAAAGDIVIPTYEGRKGHPVLLDARLIPEILTQPDGTTLRDYILARGYTAVEVRDEAVLLDIDTPADYRAALAAG
jgi:molybdenum cofactor cytidylyltransferase